MKLSTRLTLAMVALVLVTTTAIGLYAYRNIESIVQSRSLEHIETHTRLLASELEGYVRSARGDVLSFRSAAALEGIVAARLAAGWHPIDGTHESTWRDRMASRYAAELAAKPSYLQFSIIGIEDGGREIVRVTRTGPNQLIHVARNDELRPQGDQGFFQETIKLSPPQIYISSIELNREGGVVDRPFVPIMRIATPIRTSEGAVFGILMINVDMRAAFERIRQSATPGGRVYVVNERGDLLVHADRAREFGFEFGAPSRLADIFPNIPNELGSDVSLTRMVENREGQQVGFSMLPLRLADQLRIAVIETLPSEIIMEPAAAARNSSLMAGLGAILVAVVLAAFLARTFARPVVLITRAIEKFSPTGTIQLADEAIEAPGEIGVLARTFARMSAEVREKADALEREVAERRRLFETTLDLILIVDRRGTFKRVSPSSRRILGLDPEEMIGKNAIDFVHPDDLDNTRKQMRSARKGGEIRNFETRYFHKNGHPVTLAWTGVWSAPEELHFFFGRDMTEQKLAERKFKLAVESCPSGMVMVNRQGKIVMVNTETERLFGYQRDELIGRPVEILVPQRLREPHVKYRQNFAANAEGRSMGAGRDLFGLRKDGTEFPVEVGLNPIVDSGGMLTLSVIVDITERKRVLEALQNALARQEAIFASAFDGILTLNESGSIESLNTAAERMFGYSSDAVVRRDIGRLIDFGRKDNLSAVAQLRKIVSDSSSVNEIIGRNSDGSTFPIELAVAEMSMSDRKMFVLFARDLTERKRHERMKDEFVATVSHELRTPLTSISGSLGLLAGGAAGSLPAPVHRLLSIAHTNSQRLVRLINDILDIEKIESGKVTFEFKPIELRRLAEQVIEANRGFGSSYNVQIALDPASVEIMVRADPDRLTQVITNLLSNAVKFSPSGSEVTLAVESSADNARVSVRDRGPGIPESFRARIFDKFAQADVSDARDKGGTGLGLSIVKQIMMRHNGNVGFSCPPEGGTVFHADLPRFESTTELQAQDHSFPTGARLLLCEDDADAAEVLCEQLHKAGFVIDVAGTAREALLEADEKFYAGVLVDLQLPDGDGMALISQLRKRRRYSEAPIVVVSANPKRGREDARAAGLNIQDWLGKPVDMDRLLRALNQPNAPQERSRPRILHVDDDHDVLFLVAQSLAMSAEVVSVDSIEGARRALAAQQFDLAVLDVALGEGNGLDLLPDLCGDGRPEIPVIMLSAQESPELAARALAILSKSHASIDSLIAILRRVVEGGGFPTRTIEERKREVA